MTRHAAIWALAALAGFALAVGVTYAASRLSTQHVGLSSEPLTAGDDTTFAPVLNFHASRSSAGSLSLA